MVTDSQCQPSSSETVYLCGETGRGARPGWYVRFTEKIKPGLAYIVSFNFCSGDSQRIVGEKIRSSFGLKENLLGAGAIADHIDRTQSRPRECDGTLGTRYVLMIEDQALRRKDDDLIKASSENIGAPTPRF
jgi:hypothetical protein